MKHIKWSLNLHPRNKKLKKTSMKSLGLSSQTFENFVNTQLYPVILHTYFWFAHFSALTAATKAAVEIVAIRPDSPALSRQVLKKEKSAFSFGFLPLDGGSVHATFHNVEDNFLLMMEALFFSGLLVTLS